MNSTEDTYIEIPGIFPWWAAPLLVACAVAPALLLIAPVVPFRSLSYSLVGLLAFGSVSLVWHTATKAELPKARRVWTCIGAAALSWLGCAIIAAAGYVIHSAL